VENAPRYLCLAEAAELVGVKRATIYRQIRRGALPAARVGGSIRIPEAELRATLEATRTGPAAT
jgi:excisionase family DNA binding protein